MNCEICNINEGYQKENIGIWNYGKRTTKSVLLCRECLKASREGNL